MNKKQTTPITIHMVSDSFGIALYLTAISSYVAFINLLQHLRHMSPDHPSTQFTEAVSWKPLLQSIQKYLTESTPNGFLQPLIKTSHLSTGQLTVSVLVKKVLQVFPMCMSLPERSGQKLMYFIGNFTLLGLRVVRHLLV